MTLDPRNQALRPLASTREDFFSIITHPAWRLGALDALRRRPFDCDDIRRRVVAETPGRALDTHGHPAWWSAEDVQVAQSRYEEGRQVVVAFGLRFRGWSDPRFPPKAVLDWIAVGIERSRVLISEGKGFGHLRRA